MKKTSAQTKTNPKIDSLYIHIPFCHHLCHYCDFPKMLYDEKMAFSYLEHLFQELDSHRINQVKTIYVGGGTPSALSDSLFERLLQRLRPVLADGGEFSIEANVESLSDQKLLMMKSYGVNRLSIGVQSTDDDILASLNRKHSYEDVKRVVARARQTGFDNINLDLIFGIPSQSERTLKKDLKRLLALKPAHLSLYSLSVHPGTIFFLRGVKEQGEDDSRKHYDLILKNLRKSGYVRYEVSNFAKPGFSSRHNQTYWQNREYYGVGLGASGFVHGVRYDNTRSLTKYLAGQYRQSEEIIAKDEDEKYYWMLNLRLASGFLISDYVQRYGRELFETRLVALNDAIKSGLLIKNIDRIYLSDDGMMILDRILLTII
ncbi:MAG TPA: radical SAM family heme chaperone HemW [Bacilli bacterium]|nr:radical SAM family heme chaperone HemW [Bacilli bacterium]